MPLAPRFIFLQIPYPNTVILASFIATQAILLLRPVLLLIVNSALIPLLRPILLFIVNGALMPLLRPILLFIVNSALMPLLRLILLFIVNSTLIPLLRPILLFIVNGALMPLYCYKITSLQYFLLLSTSMPILICLKYSLLPIYLWNGVLPSNIHLFISIWTT